MLVRVPLNRNSFATRKSIWFNRSMNTSPAGTMLKPRPAGAPVNARPSVVDAGREVHDVGARIALQLTRAGSGTCR